MNKPVVAIGLDAADPIVLEKWMSQGYLPNLNKIREQGAYGRLNNTLKIGGKTTEFSITEPLWAMFSTGCFPEKTGFWDIVQYDCDQYKADSNLIYGGYDYHEYPPFYALGDKRRVAVFDVPVSRISEQVNGVQLFGWGGHYPFSPSSSSPSELLPDILQRYGKNPILHNDNGAWWNKTYLDWVQTALKDSISTRAKICKELLSQEKWDLFLTVFGETHTAGHDLFSHSQTNHPLYDRSSKLSASDDPMLDAYKQIDEAIGDILSNAPDDANILCFAVHGMGTNYGDLLSMMFLPELLYRFNFPNQVALGYSNSKKEIPPLILNPIRFSWLGEIWARNYEANPIKRFLRRFLPSYFLRSNHNGLESPFPLLERRYDMSLGWMPARWYQRLWPEMKAFALPAFSHGHIRINLQGRDRRGKVSIYEYEDLCSKLTEFLYQIKDARTGKLMVKDVVQTRNKESALVDEITLPRPDLIVVWEKYPTDVIESPDIGRIGPVPYHRSGGHLPEGFLLAKGSGILPGSSVSGTAVDLAPTILSLMGVSIPDYFDGIPILT